VGRCDNRKGNLGCFDNNLLTEEFKSELDIKKWNTQLKFLQDTQSNL
jgi:hypothetical protein